MTDDTPTREQPAQPAQRDHAPAMDSVLPDHWRKRWAQAQDTVDALREALSSARVAVLRLEGELVEVRADLDRVARDHAQTAAALVGERGQVELLRARVAELEEWQRSALSGHVRPASEEPAELARSQRPTPRSGTWAPVAPITTPPGGHPRELHDDDPTPTRDRRIPRGL